MCSVPVDEKEQVTQVLLPFLEYLKVGLFTFDDVENLLEHSGVIPQPLVLEAYKGA